MKTKKIILKSLAIAALPIFFIFIITRPSEHASSMNSFVATTLIGFAIIIAGTASAVWADSIKVPNSGNKINRKLSGK